MIYQQLFGYCHSINLFDMENIPWNIDEKCKLAFSSLKQAFTMAPVSTNYKPDCPLVIEINASDYALGAILSQVEPNRDIHLITYLSQTFLDTKLNYDTHNKELMAIYEAFKAWCSNTLCCFSIIDYRVILSAS